eukprot:Lithocolla_globosa_v1_NODE_808_length_3237_cov_9.760876.p1 type:complete len:240 gc:universal NODE_808_length_3237_cov_9.760876:2661-1942(-)
MNEPHYLELDLQTCMTASMNIARSKEFTKNGGIPRLLPVKTHGELQAIGKHMRENMSPKLPVYDLYSPEKISERFMLYGGIVRVVLLESAEFVRRYDSDQKDAIDGVTPEYLKTVAPTIEKTENRTSISHFLLHLNVDETQPYPFERFNYQSPSEYVDVLVRHNLTALDINACLEAVRHVFFGTGTALPTHALMYERVAAQMLHQNVDSEVFQLLDGKNFEISEKQTNQSCVVCGQDSA